jgi:hypothetical protein
MPRQEPYTCDRCRPGPPLVRCRHCRRKRAEKRRELRALKVLDGLCADCAAPVEKGYTRCREHRLLNNRLSSASHAAG